MKLHKVRLVNLNSLYGEHVIDFENDLSNAPLFLILGQTGAGKSTILDAICLALFGQTPRLSSARGRPETDARLVMSHGTNTCTAELEFSRLMPDGARHKYRAAWTCRRSRTKEKGKLGNLQDAQRSLARILDDGTEDLLISDKRRKHFLPVFDEHLDQLTVEDFQRSVMLAQGEFAAFLRADEKEKASILERLTNTDVYKRIGQRAAMRRRDVKREVEQLEGRLRDLQLLEAHEEEALRGEFTSLEAEIANLRAAHNVAQQAAAWLALAQKHQSALEAANAECQSAQEAFDGHAEQLAQLAEDKRCQVAVKPLAEARAARALLENLEEELLPLREKEAAAEAEVEAHQAQESTLTTAKNEAVAAMEAARPMLEKAAGLQRIAQRSGEELANSQSALDDAGERLAQAKAAAEAASTALEEMSAQQAENQAAYEAIAHAAPLVEAYAGLAYQTNHLHELIERVDEADGECVALKKKRKSLRQKLTVRRKKHEEADAQLAPFAARQAAAQEAQSELLGESADFRSLRDACDLERQTLRELGHTLEDAVRGFAACIELLAEGAKRSEERAALAWELEELHPAIELKQRECARHEEKLEADEVAFRTIEKTLALDDARSELAEGEPCPLCGSESHPYVKEHSGDFEEARKQVETILELERKALKERREELRELDRTLTRKSTSLQQLEEQEASWKKRHDKAIASFREACDQLNTDDLSTWLPEAGFPLEESDQEGLLAGIHQLQDATSAETAALDAKVKAIDDLREELEAASQALEDARKESDALQQEIHDLDLELAHQEEEIEKWTERLSDRSGKWESECQALVESFAGFQIVLGCEDFSASKSSMDAMVKAAQTALDEAATSKQAYEELLRKREALREHVQEVTQNVERTQASHEEAKEQHDNASAEMARRQAEHNQAEEELREVLGKDSLEETQGRLQQAVEQAEEALETNLVKLTEAKEARSKHKALREEKEATLSTQRDVLADADKALKDVLASLEILGANAVDALEARLLSEEARASIEAAVEVAQKNVEQANFHRDAAQKTVAEHTKEQPENEDLSTRDAVVWEAQADALQGELEDKRESMGVLREKMSHHEQAAEMAASYTKSLKETRESFRVWEAIDKIIGVGDGERFKQFAQSLNLQELVDRANARLLRLNPRYTLGVATGENNEPQLNFVIRDRHHADHERPLTTLSGGETFLVSLALALALADFRRIDMPIETLLLDEGFGTLDQDTLDIAMSTLRQLQQESAQQIGLISHVEMLKEQIDTRIIVEKVGNGRSVVTVESVGAQALPLTSPVAASTADKAESAGS